MIQIMNLKKYLFLSLLSIVLVSCQESDILYSPEKKNLDYVAKPIITNNVSIENVKLLYRDKFIGTRGIIDIDCICDEANDTLLYVYNKPEGGWIIFSSDSRVPAIVAESDKGSFSEFIKEKPAMVWIQSIADDFKLIKSLDDGNLNFSSSEIIDNRNFWRIDTIQNDCSIKTVLVDNCASQQGIKDLTPIEIEPRGHYEYWATTLFTEIYDSIPRLTTTNWHQNHPFNKYCPQKNQAPYDRAPAGCTAIAAAQMLFFLHDKYGVPRTAPSKAYCIGNIDKYEWAQTDYSADIWDDMRRDESAAAPFIADIGRRLKTKYGNNGSDATVKNIVSNVFPGYGISAKYTNYDVDVIKENLLNGLPVILSVRSYKPGSDKELEGHTFITDRYKRTRIRRETCYRWIYDVVPPNTPIINVQDSIVVSYQSPQIDMIGMNWGWSNSNIPSEWYSLTGDWIKVDRGDTLNYNINRIMIYVNSIKVTD